MTLHIRAHEFRTRKPRVRIWTDEMAGYEQFNVVSFDDVESLHQLFGKIGIGSLTVHHCDGTGECQCRKLTYSESLADQI